MTQPFGRRLAIRTTVLGTTIAVAAAGLFLAGPASAEPSRTPAHVAPTSSVALPQGPETHARGVLGNSVPTATTASARASVMAASAAASAGASAAPTTTSGATATAAAATASLTKFGDAGNFPYLVSAAGRVWFPQLNSTGHYVLQRVEQGGTTTSFALPDNQYEPYLFAGPDGQLWIWSPTSASGAAAGDLSRADANGVITSIATNLAGPFYGDTGNSGWAWLLHGSSALVVAADGSEHDYAIPAMDPLAAAVSTNGNLWVVSGSTSELLLVGATGTTNGPITVSPSALGGGDIASINATGDGAAWVDSSNGALALIQPNLVTTTVVSADANANWVHTAVALVPSTIASEVWMLRTGDANGNTTQILKVNETGQRLVDFTDAYDFSPAFDDAVDETTFVDSSDRLWFGEYSWTTSDARVHMASFANGRVARYTAPEGYGFFFDGFHQASDGRVWAYMDGLASLTSANVEVFDATAGTVVQYPVQTGLFPVQMVFDGSETPWLVYLQDSTGATYWGSAPKTAVQRVSGTDRYATSVAFSKASFPSGAPVVYLASGQNFPDGLSAGPAAGALGAPVLLTPTASVPAAVRAEIARLAPSKIVVVGGAASVSNAAVAQLKGLAPTVTRVAGVDRYTTSAAVAADAFPHGAATVYLASGNTFPDALSAAGAAGADHAPVLLVNGAAPTLNAATVALVKRLGASSIKIVGGTASVTAGIANAAAKLAPTTRLAGANRYATSSAVAESMKGAGAWTTAYLVSGANFADALSAGAVAAANGHPIVLAQFAGLTRQASNDLIARGTTQADVLGGYSSLSWAVGGLQVAGTSLVAPN